LYLPYYSLLLAGAEYAEAGTQMDSVKALTQEEKTTVATICEQFIAEALKPRFLPEIRPTQFNYPVDIFGKWHGSKYSFITRYRSGFAED
jgi:hypothetical protein